MNTKKPLRKNYAEFLEKIRKYNGFYIRGHSTESGAAYRILDEKYNPIVNLSKAYIDKLLELKLIKIQAGEMGYFNKLIVI